MAIINKEKAIPAPKGNIIGTKVEPIEEDAIVKPSESIFPVRFTILTGLVLLASVATLSVLMDISYALHTRGNRAEKAALTVRSFSLLTQFVEDKLSLDSDISKHPIVPKKAAEPKASPSSDEEDFFEGVAPVRQPQSPQELTRQVLRIITDASKKGTQAKKLAVAIVSESLRQKYDPLFVAAVIKSESAFNEMAISNKGAQGLMQIMPKTGKYLADVHEVNWPTPAKLTDAGYNLHLGIQYLKELEQTFQGNRLLTLIAYNWGPGKLDRAIKSGKGVPAECLRYALKILKDHNLWQNSSTAAA